MEHYLCLCVLGIQCSPASDCDTDPIQRETSSLSFSGKWLLSSWVWGSQLIKCQTVPFVQRKTHIIMSCTYFPRSNVMHWLYMYYVYAPPPHLFGEHIQYIHSWLDVCCPKFLSHKYCELAHLSILMPQNSRSRSQFRF